MRPVYCLVILQLTILAALFFAAEADSEDSNCELQIKVQRDTVYEGFLGKDLRINCTVAFCNSSPPEVSWYKLQKTVPSLLIVSSNSRIKTEWKSLKDLEGASYLIFQNTLISDSGVYLCQSGGSVSHHINVTVRDSIVEDEERINDTQKNETGNGEPILATSDPTPATSELPRSAIQDRMWPYVYRTAGLILFIIVITVICVVSKSGCKGAYCGGKSWDSPDLSGRASHHTLPTNHVYENEQ